jgi:probable HAF family extracellular repeat protein
MGYGWVCAAGQIKCSSSDTVQAYRWTVAGGYQILGSRGNSDFFGAGAVSYDGSAIAGEHPLGNTTTFEAFRWTAAHGMMQIPMDIASAITADGTMITGGDNWWNTSGQTGIFGPFPGEQNQTQAYGLSGTGQAPLAVGAAIKGSDANGATFHAFKWTPAGGLLDLGIANGTQSFATAISANGLVIVGEATDASGFWRAFRWTASGGMQDMGTLGGPESAPFAVNSDGTVIVGTSLTTGETGSSVSFVWTAKSGMQNLTTVLHAAGINTADNWVSLVEMNGVSADGTVMVGYGQSPRTKAFPFGNWEPFRVVLPVP